MVYAYRVWLLVFENCILLAFNSCCTNLQLVVLNYSLKMYPYLANRISLSTPNSRMRLKLDYDLVCLLSKQPLLPTKANPLNIFTSFSILHVNCFLACSSTIFIYNLSNVSLYPPIKSKTLIVSLAKQFCIQMKDQ